MKDLRVAVLGNSHAASLRKGWDLRNGRIPGIADITFFARPNGRGGIGSLRAEGGVIVADDAELREWFQRTAGTTQIEPARFDVFLIHAFGPDATQVYNAARALGRHVYSKALVQELLAGFEQKVDEAVETMPQVELCRLLRSVTAAPVLVTHKPLFAHASAEGQPTPAIAGELHRRWLSTMARVIAANGGELLPQPVQTIVERCYTADRYAKGDRKHMEAEYGALLLEALGAEAARAVA